jgi:hypothetical protein
MQWQTVAEGKEKDRWERIGCTTGASDKKLLDDYAHAVESCGTGLVVLDKASGLYVPEFDAACLWSAKR